MLIKLLTEARKSRDNRARSAINLLPEDGYLQLVGDNVKNTLHATHVAFRLCIG